MKTKIEPTTWMYSIVINPGHNEKLLGQVDPKKNISFIPAFRNRSAAEKGLHLFSIEREKKHEVHAIIYEDLAKYASDEKFAIFIIDEKGNIENCIFP